MGDKEDFVEESGQDEVGPVDKEVNFIKFSGHSIKEHDTNNLHSCLSIFGRNLSS